MGKTLRYDAKYPNELHKHTKDHEHVPEYGNERTHPVEKGRKGSQASKKSKRFLKGNFLQRIWPFASENKKGHKI